jgi:hypothetical protein
MPSTLLIARTRAAFNVITGVALTLPTHGADEIAVILDEEACAVRLKAIIRGTLEHAQYIAEEMRSIAERRGYRLLGGAGFDISRTGLTPEQQRIQFLCTVQ